jgi:hypothetical protein
VDTVLSAADGSFVFDLVDPESFNRRLAELVELDTATLLAVKAGHLPGELRAERTDEDGHPVWPDAVVLRLGEEPLGLSGRVVDHAGELLEGIRVRVSDPTFLGSVGRRSSGFPELTHVESFLTGGDPGWTYVETDARGEFVLGGLLDRTYTVQALDPATLLRAPEVDVHAGTERLEFAFPEDGAYASLPGRVVDGRGAPVVDATVATMCDAFRTRIQGQPVSTRHASGPTVRTGANGEFELEDVPRDLVYLRIDRPDTIPLEWGRGVAGGLGHLVGEELEGVVVTVMRRCHFRLELPDPEEADALEILDAAGERMTISEFLGNGRRDGPRAAIVDGRTTQLGVGDPAATLVLLREGAEVRRVTLSLDPRQETVLRP